MASGGIGVLSDQVGVGVGSAGNWFGFGFGLGGAGGWSASDWSDGCGGVEWGGGSRVGRLDWA